MKQPSQTHGPTIYAPILTLINEQCRDILPIHRQETMAVSLTQWVLDAVEKYRKGQAKYGGDITDKDLNAELRQESLDFFWYSEARKWKEDRK